MNVEAAYRSQGEDCRRNLVEATVGVDMAPTVHTMIKAWSETGDKARSVKAEASLLYDMTSKYSVGHGYRREISGAFDEDGLVVALWTRF